jgi:hypothetical protein
MVQSIILKDSYDISGLDMIFILCNLLLELVQRDLLVLDNQVDVELLDTVAERNQFGSSPDETVLLNTADILLKLSHVRLVILKQLAT